MIRARRLSVLAVSLAAAAVLSCSGKPETREARETAHDGREGDTVRIEVLSIKGCQVTPPTIDLVKTTAEEMGVSYDSGSAPGPLGLNPAQGEGNGL